MLTKRLHILKQNCSFELQVYLSMWFQLLVCLRMCDLFVTPGTKGLKDQNKNHKYQIILILIKIQIKHNCNKMIWAQVNKSSFWFPLASISIFSFAGLNPLFPIFTISFFVWKYMKCQLFSVIKLWLVQLTATQLRHIIS